MRTGIISDIHGNYDALEVVLTALSYEAVDRIVCLGDIVGYGPEPDFCVEKTLEVCHAVVLGNHDAAITGQIDTRKFNSIAYEAILWTKKNISEKSVKALASIPDLWRDEDITIVHGSPVKNSKWEYILSVSDAEYAFDYFDTKICFIGHSHKPCAFIHDSTKIIIPENTNHIEIEPDKRYIINTGSVGQPRDGDPRAAYGILDTDKGLFELKRLVYPVEPVQDKIKNCGLPWQLGYRLSLGQ